MKRKIDAISSGMAIAIAFWPGAGAGDLVRPRGGEFSVNTETEGEAYEAAVALDVAGNALFAWSASSSSGRRIEARFMDAEGVFQGPPSRISDPTPPPAVNLPRITPLAESRFLVVWDSFPAVPNPGFGARAQLVEGPHTSNAPDFGLSASSLESYTPDSCVLSSGKLLVSWSGFPSDVYRTAPWLRMFDANGGALTGDVRLDSPEREDEAEELLARVACGGNERAVVVWLAQNPDDPLEIFVEGRLVGPGLEFLSPVFRVSDLPLAEYYPADVVMAPDGSFTVIYMGLLDGALDILGRRFTAEGNRQGEVFLVNEYRPGGEFLGQADSDSSGNFAVVWEQATDPSGRLSEVYARVFLADGTPYGPSFHVNPDPIDDSFTDSAPSVSFADGGRLAFAWQSWLADGDDFGVRGARFELGCTTDEMTLCLSGGRFEVQAKFRGGNDLEGAGTAIQLGDESGGFSFFENDNLEIVVKVLNGCGVNDRFWLYTAGLTDLDVELSVTDGWTGRVWTQVNPLSVPFPSAQDVNAFDTCGARSFGHAVLTSPTGSTRFRAGYTPQSQIACVPDAEHLCLRGGRFRVSATFSSGDAPVEPASSIPFGQQSGLFWFFWPENLELIVKVLDGCVPYEHYWVFVAGLTNVGVQLTVEDLVTGSTWTHTNQLGDPFAPVLDSAAFATCQ